MGLTPFEFLAHETGISSLTLGHVVMWVIAFIFLYLAIKKDFEPLLLVPIGFSIFIVKLPDVPLVHRGDLRGCRLRSAHLRSRRCVGLCDQLHVVPELHPVL